MNLEEDYIVRIVRPEGVSVLRMRQYIKEAVDCWSGQFNPDEDPLFGHRSCTVKRSKATRKP